jgi:hypothetical protein
MFSSSYCENLDINTVMTTINSEQFGEICNGVWRDRAAVLSGRGLLSGEATLVRAVFWRLCKAGVNSTVSAENYSSQPTILAYQVVVGRMLEVNARPAFDGAPILKELLDRYKNEVGGVTRENGAAVVT